MNQTSSKSIEQKPAKEKCHLLKHLTYKSIVPNEIDQASLRSIYVLFFNFDLLS